MKYKCRDCKAIHNKGTSKCQNCGSIYLVPTNFVRKKFRPEKETLSSRLFSSLFLSSLVALTIMLVPLIIMFKAASLSTFGAGKAPILYAIYTKTWFVYIMGLSAFTGFFLGSDKTFTFLGHMWGTEKPTNSKITGLIWFTIIIICYFSYKNST